MKKKSLQAIIVLLPWFFAGQVLAQDAGIVLPCPDDRNQQQDHDQSLANSRARLRCNHDFSIVEIQLAVQASDSPSSSSIAAINSRIALLARW